MINLIATLRTPDGQVFVIHDSYDYDEEGAEFLWTEGNFACDCNRRRFIGWEYPYNKWGEDGDETENPCGHTITLMSLANVDTGFYLVREV